MIGWLVALTLLSHSLAAAPFIPANTVHQAKSQLELNLILNENRHSVVLLCIHQDIEKKEVDILRDIMQGAFENEPNAGFGLMVDCKEFNKDLEGVMNICKKKKSEQGSYEMLLFKPKSTVMTFMGHDIYGVHDNMGIQDNTMSAFTKWIRSSIPNHVVDIQDTYDLEEFLKEQRMAKIIFFDEDLLTPPYLVKTSASFIERADVAVCDNKEVAQQYGATFPSLMLLSYNYIKKQYDKVFYKGTLDYQDLPYEDIRKFVEPFVLPNRSRNILIDFQLIRPQIVNFTDINLLQKFIKQDKMAIAQISSGDCADLQEIINKYGVMFNYACVKHGLEGLEDVSDGKILLFQNEYTQRLEFNIKEKIENILKFPELQHIISTEKEADIYTEMAATKNKILVMAYYPDKSHQKWLVKYFNSLPQYNSIYIFCQVYNPDKFLQKTYNFTMGSINVMMPQPGGKASQKVQNTGSSDFGDMKFFLRQFAVKTFQQMYNDAMKQPVPVITGPESLTKWCFSKPCVLGLINMKKKTRAKQEIEIIGSLAREFRKQFNVAWLDGDCHRQLLSQLKIKAQDLSSLVYFNEKSNEYLTFPTKYWIQKDVKKWFKKIRAGAKLNKLKYSLDMAEKNCEKDDQL